MRNCHNYDIIESRREARQIDIRNAILTSHVGQLEAATGIAALLLTGPDGRLTLTAYGKLFARDVRPALE